MWPQTHNDPTQISRMLSEQTYLTAWYILSKKRYLGQNLERLYLHLQNDLK